GGLGERYVLRGVFPIAVVGLSTLIAAVACSSLPASPSPAAVEDGGITDAQAEEDAALPPPVAFTPAELQDVIDVKCVRCHTQIDVLDLRDYAPATIGVAPESSDARAKCKDGAQKMIIAPGDRAGSLLY